MARLSIYRADNFITSLPYPTCRLLWSPVRPMRRISRLTNLNHPTRTGGTDYSVQRGLTSMTTRDCLRIGALSLQLPNGIGPSAFGLTPAPPCPANLTVSLDLREDVVPSCVNDDTQGGLGVDYSAMSKQIIALSSASHWRGPGEFLKAIAETCLANEVVQGVEVDFELPKASLQAESVVYKAIFSGRLAKPAFPGPQKDKVSLLKWSGELRNIRCMTIIGLRPYEREEKQWVALDIKVENYNEHPWDHRVLAKEVYQWVERSSFGTIEAFADSLASHLLKVSPCLHGTDNVPEPSVQITVRKPSALPFAVPSLTIRRTSSDLQRGDRSAQGVSDGRSASTTLSASNRRIFIGLGSNMGDRVGNISRAVKELKERGINVVSCSKLYESEPMYHEDQARFVNGVIEVSTQLGPMQLLQQLKAVEKQVGRTKTFKNGPRVVDLDLLLYGDEIIHEGEVGSHERDDGIGWLECPHPRIAEREFVLRPLNDLAPSLVHPQQSRTIDELLTSLSIGSPSTLTPIIAFPAPASPLSLTGRPRIMQIFNATPDSFSDGDIAHLDTAKALKNIEGLIDPNHPPDILDIGGMSTRPNAAPCPEQEEVDRVVPLIRALRNSSNPVLSNLPISIDTYRPNVARAAVEAGASCINDVRGGSEPGMLATMAELDVPVVLMHSRGNSTTMTLPVSKDYSALGGVIGGIKIELGDRVRNALAAGVKSWNIVIDPGLGFAKSLEDNLIILRHLLDLTAEGSPLHGYPLLVGGSRKGFVGLVTGRKEPTERIFGDSAVVGWCLAQGGVSIVRVHEGKGMGELVQMWDAIDAAPGMA